MLSSYRVLDISDEKGLFCGALLGRLGADVIKIERVGGDAARNIGPFFRDIPDPQKSLLWFAFNTNKRGITLNIETADGKEIFKKLVKTADVVIESFEPGYMDDLGLSYPELEKINRGIIMTSITPFGQAGPYVDGKYKASDLVCWSLGGMLFSTGSLGRGPVRISHLDHAYLLGSSDAAWGTVMALYWRGISGEGQHVDVSIQESVVKHAQFEYVEWKISGIPFTPVGNGYVVPPFRDIHRTQWVLKDGTYIAFYVTGGLQSLRLIGPLLEWMASEGMVDEYIMGIDWANTVFEQLPREEIDRIHGYFDRFFRTKTKQELINEISKRELMIDIIWTPKEVLEHPQLKARGYWQELEHSDIGITFTYPGQLYMSPETTSKLDRRAPLIGEHNEEIYMKELGLTKNDLVVLKQCSII